MAPFVAFGAAMLAVLAVLVWFTVKYVRGDVDEWLRSSRLAGEHGDEETAMNILLGGAIAIGCVAGAVWQWHRPDVRWAFLVVAAITGTVALGALDER